MFQFSLDPLKIRMTEFTPFGADQESIGPRQRLIVAPMVRHASAEDSASVVESFGIMHPHLCPCREKLLDDDQGRCFTHVIGSRLESQAPHGEFQAR